MDIRQTDRLVGSVKVNFFTYRYRAAIKRQKNKMAAYLGRKVVISLLYYLERHGWGQN